MSTPRPIGIDLGTTNSCVATIDGSGRTAMVPNAEGDLLTPSVVLFDDAEVIVGKEARKVAAIKPGQVAEWVKRDMGTPVYSRPIRGEYLPPEVIQACILRKLREDATAALGPDLQAVITVPAYFDEPRRKATADAGEMAGLKVLDIVNEPTAAALAFGEALGYLAPAGVPRERLTVAVYDLGGGTFDATLLRLAPGDVRTVATDGDVQLGGFDWDMRLLNYAADWFKNAYHVDPRDDPASWQRLYQGVVEAKHSLSVRSRAAIRIEHAGHSGEVQVAREQFQEMTADLLERTAYTSRQLVAAAKLQWSEVNRILLVGGSTRMPLVPQMLQQMSGIVPDHTVNPDEAVARGAAIFANYLLAKRTAGAMEPAFRVTDVNSHSLGIEGIDQETLRKTNVVLIRRNTPLPARFTHRFVTKSESQRSIVIQVLEGESTLPGECNAIGRTVIRDLPLGLPKGWPVEVTFEYGTNGRLSVQAVVTGTHSEVTLELERDGRLSSEGISRWKQAVCGVGGFGAFGAMPVAAPPLAAPSAAGASGAAVMAPPPLPAQQPLFSQPAPLASPPAQPAAEHPLFSQPVPILSAPAPLAAPPADALPPSASGPPVFDRLGETLPAGALPLAGLRPIPEAGGLQADEAPLPQPIVMPQTPVAMPQMPAAMPQILVPMPPAPAAVPDHAAQAAEARRKAAARRVHFVVLNILGYGVSAIAGLTIGYWIVRLFVPDISIPWPF